MSTADAAAVAADRSADAGQANQAARARILADFWRVQERVTALLAKSGAMLDQLADVDQAVDQAADEIPY